jgi:hypothetical protein
MRRDIAHVVFLVIIATGTAAAQGGSAARDYTEQMTELAVGWQSDAVLTQIGAWMVYRDGTADLGSQGWFYTFYSPATKHWRLFQLGATGFVQRDVPSAPTDPIPEAFMDSKEAMASAIKAGYKPQEENLMLLGGYTAKRIPEGVYWIVGRAEQRTGPTSARGYFIDALTGKFVGRL